MALQIIQLTGAGLYNKELWDIPCFSTFTAVGYSAAHLHPGQSPHGSILAVAFMGMEIIMSSWFGHSINQHFSKTGSQSALMSMMGSGFPSGHRGFGFVTTNGEKMTSMVMTNFSPARSLSPQCMSNCGCLTSGKPSCAYPFSHCLKRL